MKKILKDSLHVYIPILIAIVTLFLVYKQISDASTFFNKSYQRDYRINSFERTVELYNKIQTKERILFKKYNNVIPKPEGLSAEEVVIVTDMLSELEMFAFAVNNEIYDLNILSGIMGSNIIKKYDRYRASIEVCDSKSCYLELTVLVKNLRNMRNNNQYKIGTK